MAKYNAQDIIAACPTSWVMAASDRIEAFARGVEAAVQWVNNQGVEPQVSQKAAKPSLKPKASGKARRGRPPGSKNKPKVQAPNPDTEL